MSTWLNFLYKDSVTWHMMRRRRHRQKYARSSLVDDSRLSFRVVWIRLVVATLCFVYTDGDDTMKKTTTPFQGVQNTNVGVRYMCTHHIFTHSHTYTDTYEISFICFSKTQQQQMNFVCVNLSENKQLYATIRIFTFLLLLYFFIYPTPKWHEVTFFWFLYQLYPLRIISC